MSNSPIQKILFGSPGTGKSHKIKTHYAEQLGIDPTSENYISTVFHPEYTYGDFMGKLMPLTKGGVVDYTFYTGHFLKALAQAYKEILEVSKKGEFETITQPKNVILVIDELNRGNSAAIFGTVFQLLDRDETGWSSYGINITKLEMLSLLEEMGMETKPLADKKFEYKFPKESHWVNEISIFKDRVLCLKMDIEKNKIYLPSNLSIIATMNTSDNSIYFMDNAFKRRWDWEFIEIEDETQKEKVKRWSIELYKDTLEYQSIHWGRFVDKLNKFIRSKYKVVRKIEDKQIGYRFINKATITEEDIKSKLMFFVWDSVFTTDKKPLVELLGVSEGDLITFGQFSHKNNVIKFVNAIFNYV